ncbi:hypothetical protein GUJ93_ZPchr0008g12400 [Zizania palustris]|uniref:1-phosphatidylinositol 4-kinase n=1 Tax=Zizania palustris TaxID=103762 RepID=A0A8J5RG00_ZIZPA|nr:hypothetical protein GUJ93_ZPchr0008g12400 [Zizania palustris]
MASTEITVSPSNDGLGLAAEQLDGSQSPRRAPEPMLIYIAMPGSSFAPLQVLASDSIATVKLRIQNSKGFLSRNQILVFDGRELSRKDCTIVDYGVGYGDVLHLVTRLSDLRRTTVRTVFGRRFRLHLEQQRRNAGCIKLRDEGISKKPECSSDAGGSSSLLAEEEKLEDGGGLVSNICEDPGSDADVLTCNSDKLSAEQIDEGFEPLADVASDMENELQSDAKKEYPLVEPVFVDPDVSLPPAVMGMIQATLAGLEKEHAPVMSSQGTGGVYFMFDSSGQDYVAVFKPVDEEPMAMNNPQGFQPHTLSSDGEGLKKGTKVGEGAFREVAAYILDHPASGHRGSDELGFAGVPPTVLVRCLHGVTDQKAGCDSVERELKIGSLQMFMKNSGSCEDIGPGAFPVQEVHKIAVLDMRLANADRHGGNILFHKDDDGQYVLIPIDHGYCLPESFEDCTFEWLYWRQAREPFSAETLSYIESLDVEEDVKLLKLHGWQPSLKSARVLRIGTMVLKKGVARGLTAYQIGNVMCRETIRAKSKIEEIVEEAEGAVLAGTDEEEAFMEAVSGIMDRRLNELFN